MPSLFRPRFSFLPLSRICALLLAAALAGCAATPKAPLTAAAAEDRQVVKDEAAEMRTAAPLPGLELTPGIVYQLLLAEIAAQRGEMNVSVGAYADLARTTRDPRILRRATEIALFSRQNEVMLELARIWVEVEPESMRARQVLVGGLVGVGKFDEVEPHVLALLKRDQGHAGELLLRLARAVAASPQRRELSALLERMASTQSALPESHFVRALAAQASGDKERAIAEIGLALSGRPGWEQAALFRAQLQQESGRFPDAMAGLKAFLEANPQARDVRMQYAKALAAGKQYGEAREQFLVLEKGAPDNPEVIHGVAILSLQLGDMNAAEQRFKTLVRMGVGNTNALRMALGQLEEARKHPDEAMVWYEAVTLGEQFLPARMRYAGLLVPRKGVDAAVDYLRNVPATNESDRAQLILGQSQLLRTAGRQKEAYEVLERGLKDAPDQTDLLYESALMAERLGHKDVLEKNLRRLIKLKPDHAHAYNALGYSLAERGERLDEALSLIAKAVELAPGDPFILDSLGWVYFRKGNLETAREKLAQAMGIRPDPEIAAHLGEVLWKLGRQDEAKTTWREAARQSPDNEALTATMKKFLPAAK